MKYFVGRAALGVAAGMLGFVLSASSAVDTGIDVLANRVYIHRDSKTFIRVPVAWGDVPDPYRLRKHTPSSVMSLDRADPRINVTIVWTPLGSRPFSEVIRAAEDENLGEEYALLTTVYGKTKVSRPTTLKLGVFTVYKILLDDGPEGPARSAGAVYLWEVGAGESRWKIKVRAVYSQINKEENMKLVEELIGQFGYATDKGP